MLNRITLIGRVVRDCELKQTRTGIPKATFTLAVSRSYSKRGGKKEVDYFDCFCWRETAEFADRNLGKGRLVCVDGSMLTEHYKTEDGRQRKIYEVTANQIALLDRRPTKAPEDEMGTEVRPDASELPF